MKKLELNVPESLSEITLKQYQKFIEVSNNNTDDAFVAQKMIEIFCNVSLANVVQMKVTSIMELNEHFRKVFDVKPKFKNRFTIDGIEFGFIPNIEEITFEEYVDIEHYLKDIKDLHKALAIMYRPIKKKQKDLYEIESKEYGERFSEVLRYAPLDVVIPAKVFFLEFSKRIIEDYAILFGEGDEEDQEDFTPEGQFSRKWGWYHTIVSLADGDITKFDEVTRQGLRKCLTLVSYKVEQNKIERIKNERILRNK